MQSLSDGWSHEQGKLIVIVDFSIRQAAYVRNKVKQKIIYFWLFISTAAKVETLIVRWKSFCVEHLEIVEIQLLRIDNTKVLICKLGLQPHLKCYL